MFFQVNLPEPFLECSLQKDINSEINCNKIVVNYNALFKKAIAMLHSVLTNSKLC